jgi:hypothetical protein
MQALARTTGYDRQAVVGQVCLALARDADVGIINRQMHHGQGPTCASWTWHLWWINLAIDLARVVIAVCYDGVLMPDGDKSGKEGVCSPLVCRGPASESGHCRGGQE